MCRFFQAGLVDLGGCEASAKKVFCCTTSAAQLACSTLKVDVLFRSAAYARSRLFAWPRSPHAVHVLS